MVTLQLFFTYSTLMNQLFHTEPIGLIEWALILLVSFAIYFSVKLEKQYRLKKGGITYITLCPISVNI